MVKVSIQHRFRRTKLPTENLVSTIVLGKVTFIFLSAPLCFFVEFLLPQLTLLLQNRVLTTYGGKHVVKLIEQAGHLFIAGPRSLLHLKTLIFA